MAPSALAVVFSGMLGPPPEPPPSCTTAICGDFDATCGVFPDGCGGILDCGGCVEGAVCGENFLCTPAACVPLRRELACATLECGIVSDGCGGVLWCDPCPEGTTCGATAPFECGVLGPEQPSCLPAVCEPDACGLIADGCGEIVECLSCPEGLECEPFSAECRPISVVSDCVPASCGEFAECGLISDGCGGLLDCGSCLGAMACGVHEAFRCGPVEMPDSGDAGREAAGRADGGAWVDAGSDGDGRDLGCPGNCEPGPPSSCPVLTCADLETLEGQPVCGAVGDGCGGRMECGACPNPGDDLESRDGGIVATDRSVDGGSHGRGARMAVDEPWHQGCSCRLAGKGGYGAWAFAWIVLGLLFARRGRSEAR